METLRDYVNWGITHSDKTASAEGVPLVLENCVKNKKLKQLEVYGNSVQNGTPTPEAPVEVESVGELVTDVNDTNYGKYKIPVTVRGKNLFVPTVVSANTIKTTRVPTLNGAYGTVIDSTDFSDNKVIVTQTPNSDYGTDSYRNGFVYLEAPELVIGEKYILSFDLNITNNPFNATSLVMYALDTGIGNVSITSTRCKIKFTYKNPSTGRKPDIELRCGGASFELSNVMITEEGQDEIFEPYVEPITTNVYLNEPLRKIGDYADCIDFKAKKVVRNTLKRVYDGVSDNNNPFNKNDNENNFGVASGNDNFHQYTLADLLPVIPNSGHADYKHNPLCIQLPTHARHYDSSEVQKVAEEQIWFTSNGRNVNIFLSKSREGLGDGGILAFKAYLKANPITVYCAIYEPYEEPITCELPTLPAKTSIVEIDTSILPSNIKGKYIKR